MAWWCWHKWGKWEDSWLICGGERQSAQKRYCEKCGKKQIRSPFGLM